MRKDLLWKATLSLLLVLVPNSAVRSATESDVLLGDWAGWAYLDEGGDVPLRLRIDRGPEGLRARFDELVWKTYDLPSELSWDAPRLTVTRTRPTGTRIVLDGAMENDEIRGRIEWGGQGGDFDLSRSSATIARIAPERFQDLTGTYRLTPERTLVVSARFWGELLVTDLSTGRHATLFPTDSDSFFVGGAMYVPSPIQARVRFERNDEGEPVSVTWDDLEGPSLSGPRIPFVEEDIAFESDGARLAGTLIRPAGAHALPAAVVLPGSGWAGRDDARRDAEILSSFGMATLIYDKRGHAESGGEPTVSFRQTARDAAAAVTHLARRDDVLSDQVGITGRSRGGWFAPLAATMAPETAFVVLFVPPAVSPAVQETTRRLNLLRRQGYSVEEIGLARSMLESAWRYAATGKEWDEYAALREQARTAELPEEIFEPADREDPEWEWTRLNMDYDPIPALESLRVPILALFGEKDRNVVVAENLPPMRAALERAGNPDFTHFVVPGADHGLRTVTRDPDVPFHRRVGFGPAGWSKVAQWLGKRFDLGAPGG